MNCGVLEVGDGGAELLAALGVVDRLVEAALAAAEAAGADVEAPAVETHHRDAEAFALAADAVGDRHADLVEIDLHGRLRCQPSFFSLAPKLTPFMSFSMTKALIPLGPSSPVRTIAT